MPLKSPYNHFRRIRVAGWRYLALLGGILLGSVGLYAQTYAPITGFKACFYDSNGNPLSGGKVYTYQNGTTTPQSTWTDSTGSSTNANPVILDGSGCNNIWVNNLSYKFVLQDSTGAQQYSVDNVQQAGLSALAKAVLLAPSGGANQTITGPLTVTYLTGSAAHTTSTGIRVSLLDPTTVLDTASNPPSVTVTQPAVASQVYTIPDPGTLTANFVLSPGTTANTLDCTKVGLSCIHTAYAYFEGGGCNNTTAGLGWDNFGTNSPTPICVTGTNVQKGVMAMPSAATPIQTATCTGAAATTCVVAMPKATTAHDLLVIACAVDGGKTITTVSDGTNSYSKATSVTNGNTDLEVWYFNGDSASASGNITVTLAAAASANTACRWREYADIAVASMLDKTATNTGTGTAVTSGTTVGTSQNTELVLVAVASPSNPSVTASSGFSNHGAVSQSTNITVDTEALIQQATATQSGSFTLGSSQAWAAGVATFKANVGSNIVAQRHFRLPAAFLASQAVNAYVNWQAPLVPTGTVNVKLGAALACSAAGSTDDPAMNTATTATALVPASAANTLTDTALTSLTTTGCAAGNMMHFQVQRNRYDANDTYEGYVYVNGTAVSFGSSQ